MRASVVLPLAVACGLLAANTDSGRAQRTEPFQISEIKAEYLKTTSKNLMADKTKRTALKQLDEWLEIEVTFRAEPEDLQGDFLDEIEVRIHVLTPEDKIDQKREAYSCELRFSPVPKSRELYASAYLPPTVVERFGGKSAFQNQSNVAAEVFYKGRPVAEKELKVKGDRAGQENWYTRGGKRDVLLPRSRTPFALDFWDRYLPESPAAR